MKFLNYIHKILKQKLCKRAKTTHSKVWQSPDNKNIKTLGNPKNSLNTKNQKEDLSPSHINEDNVDITHTESTESLSVKPKGILKKHFTI